jgi:acetyl-CoA carboxylase biotin carboxyl carrier protein
MLKIQEIRELIRLVDGSNINEFEYENDGLRLIMKKNQPVEINNTSSSVTPVPVVVNPVQASQQTQNAPVSQPAQTAVEPVREERATTTDENLHKITSPMVGTFYTSSSPDAEPFVKVGDKVQSDTVVCIVEAMKLFNEIEAEVDGEIVEILVQNGQLVEFGQPLFLVKAN